MIIYIAGPMTHRPKFNYPAFDAAAKALREAGWEVQSPAEMDDPATRARAMRSRTGKPWTKPEAAERGETWGDFLSRDVKLIADSDIGAMCLLPEWETSKGARLEAFVAMNLNYPIYFYEGDGTLRQLNYERILDDIKETIIQ